MYFIIAAVIVLADQMLKYVFIEATKTDISIEVIKNFFYITYVENRGAAWGVFQNGRYFFITLTVITVIVISYLMLNSDKKSVLISLSFILGGALGNMIDRVAKGYVVDFLDFYFGIYHFPTFNLADVFICIGTIILMIYVLLYERLENKEEFR